MPTVTFRLPDGAPVRFTSPTGTSPNRCGEGQTVDIVYDPVAGASQQPPFAATIVSLWQPWTLPILLAMLGSGSVLFSIALARLVTE